MAQVDKVQLQSNYQNPGDIYSDTKTEASLELIADQHNETDQRLTSGLAASVAPGSVDSIKLGPHSVTRPKIAPGAVGGNELDPALLQNFGDIAVQGKFQQIDSKTNWVDANQFGNLQDAIDYASLSGKPLRNFDKSKVYTIDKPLYIDGNMDIDLNNAEIRKINNVVGSGANAFSSILDYYTVDSHIILRHQDYGYTKFVKLRNIRFTSTAANVHTYAVFAPRCTECEFENLVGQPYKFNKLILGFLWYIIPKLDNLRLDGGECVFHLSDDGLGAGGSTSIHSKLIVGTAMQSCFKIFGLSYSVFDIPLIDYGNDYAFRISSCKGITLNSPSTEWLQSGKFIFMENSNVVMNTPRAVATVGSTSGDVQYISVQAGSKLVVNNGEFTNYSSGTPANNLILTTAGGSTAILNSTNLPTNGNPYNAHTGNSIVIKQDLSGSTMTDQQISGQATNGLIIGGRRIFYSSSIPTSGTFNRDDVVIFNNHTASGYFGAVCVTAGTPGTWKRFGAIEA